jgi:hypothetical protein
MPAITANKMEGYCDQLTKLLQDANACEDLITRAAEVVKKAADGHFDTDTIRTEPFTEKVIGLACEAVEAPMKL